MKPHPPWFILTLFLVLAVEAAEPRPAPSCRVPALAGATIDPAAFKGQVVYLDFWASWCIPCAKSFPWMNQLSSELSKQGLQIIAINLDETRADALRFLERYPADFAIGLDPEGRCPRLYGVKGMPTSYLIDRQGNIRYTHQGFKTADIPKIRAHLESLLAEPGP